MPFGSTLVMAVQARTPIAVWTSINAVDGAYDYVSIVAREKL